VRLIRSRSHHPHGHRHPQAQIQGSRGEVFCSHFPHVGQCRVQMCFAAVSVSRDCTMGCDIRCLSGGARSTSFPFSLMIRAASDQKCSNGSCLTTAVQNPLQLKQCKRYHHVSSIAAGGVFQAVKCWFHRDL
jgi:hypothetical protein